MFETRKTQQKYSLLLHKSSGNNNSSSSPCEKVDLKVDSWLAVAHAFQSGLDFLLSEDILAHALQNAQAVGGPPSPQRLLPTKIAPPLQEHADYTETQNTNTARARQVPLNLQVASRNGS